MEITSRTEGNKVTMEISGWLDTQTAPKLEEELSHLDDSVTSLVFDFAKLEYISSAGLRQVISAYKKMAGKDGFKIIHVSDEVLAERRAKWQPREPKVTTGYLARYAAMVTSGNRGAILEVPKAK